MDCKEWELQKKRVVEYEETLKQIASFEKVKDALYYRGYNVYLVAHDISDDKEVARVSIPFTDLPCKDETHIRSILYEWVYSMWRSLKNKLSEL